MGRNSQQRRKAKERTRTHDARGGSFFAATGPAGVPGDWPSTPDDQAQDLIGLAFLALERTDAELLASAVDRLASSDRPGWRRVVEIRLVNLTFDVLGALWQHGWQPADVSRIVARKLESRHLGLAVAALAAERRRYADATVSRAWDAQLAELDAVVAWPSEQTFLGAWFAAQTSPRAVVRCLLELLAFFDRLPHLERLMPLPGQFTPVTGRPVAAPEVDERILSRVRALLAKAESTTYEAEAATFTAGAHALMARHSIDLAMLATTDRTAQDEPAARRVGIDNPYEEPKAILCTLIAEASRCRAVWSKELGYSTIVGYPSDLNAVDVLFTSLLVQATAAMQREGSHRDPHGRSRTRSFRHAFLSAYAHRIGERLRQTTEQETARAVAEAADDRLLPVLAARDETVSEAVDALFPALTERRRSWISSGAGWAAGLEAADRATLDLGVPLSGPNGAPG